MSVEEKLKISIGDEIVVTPPNNEELRTKVIGVSIYVTQEGSSDKSEIYLDQNNEPKVRGAENIPYKFHIQENFMSSDKFVDVEILSQLDDQSLNNFCLTSKYAKNICDDDLLWETKTRKLVDDSVLENKPVDMTYRELYDKLKILTGDYFAHLISNGHIDELEFYYNMGILPTDYDTDREFRITQESLDWLNLKEFFLLIIIQCTMSLKLKKAILLEISDVLII